MPKFDTDNLENHQLPTGAFGFSAVALDDLGATEYTLVTIVVDTSSSVISFAFEMEKAISAVINACKLSPRADNLMIRFTTFNSQMNEEHGFKLLPNCNPDDYIGCLNCCGMTAVFDATENAVSATNSYAKMLDADDYSVNGLIVVITDGCDNRSVETPNSVKKALTKSMKDEYLESLITILIGVGTKGQSDVKQFLSDFNDEAGFTQYEEVENANPKTLAKLGGFISKSISAQSLALGSGAMSQPISLKI